MRRARAASILLITGLLTAACASHYSTAELREGIDHSVDDPEDLVESATLIAFNELPGSTQISHRIGDGGSIVLDPGLRGYEVIVAYRTGPYCAIVPSVAVHSNDAIVVQVVSHERAVCEDMEYAEAIGFNFATTRAGKPIVIRHCH